MIGEEIRVAVNPGGNFAGRVRQFWSAFIASLGGFALGVCLGWNSSSSELLKNYVNADSLLLGLVGGIFNLGVCASLAILPIILRTFSRIGVILMTLPILLLGWSCIAFAGQRVPLLLLGRVLCGFSGTSCVLAPIYVGEIADRQLRGSLLALFQLLVNLGVMFSYTLAHFTADQETVWLYSLACALTATPIALATLAPESPTYHLLVKGDETQARTSLEFFRGKGSPGIDAEIDRLKHIATFNQSHRAGFTALGERRVLSSLAASFALMIMYQFSGISPFIFYTLAIFHAGGSGDISPSLQTLVVGGALIGGGVIAAITIDTWGRRPLLIASSGLMGSSLFLLGWFFTVQHEDPEYADELSWMPLTWTALLFGAFSLGVGPIAWVFLGETFLPHVKLGAAVSMALINWLAALALTLLFGEMLDGMGDVKTMWFFGGFCFAGTIFTIFFINETSLSSIPDIQPSETGITHDQYPNQSTHPLSDRPPTFNENTKI